MIGWLTRTLRGQGMRKGVLGGDPRWLTIWVVVAAVQTTRKLLRPKPVVERIQLHPGETVMITDLGVSEKEL